MYKFILMLKLIPKTAKNKIRFASDNKEHLKTFSLGDLSLVAI